MPSEYSFSTSVEESFALIFISSRDVNGSFAASASSIIAAFSPMPSIDVNAGISLPSTIVNLSAFAL